ncbi:MAG TPA: TatD family deoxyribonuclease, partial [Bacteroidetes bacterium]|nr:TatD family deoxyribonuclease [Bacteroidota bacterium]
MEAQLVDSHAHLNFDAFDEDREDVLRRAREAGLVALVNVGIDVPTSEASVELAEKYPDVWATVGVHPHDAKSLDDAGRDRLRELVRHPKVVAVGEVGLDFYYDYSPRELQESVFREMIALAREADKPLVIHTREAWDRVLAVLEEELRGGPLRGVFHCFSGDVTQAGRVLAWGFHVSFCGNLTFKN